MKFQIFIYLYVLTDFSIFFSLIEDTEAPRSPQHDSELPSLPSESSRPLEPCGLSGPLGPFGTSEPSKPCGLFEPSVQSWVPEYSWPSKHPQPLGPSVFLLLDTG